MLNSSTRFELVSVGFFLFGFFNEVIGNINMHMLAVCYKEKTHHILLVNSRFNVAQSLSISQLLGLQENHPLVYTAKPNSTYRSRTKGCFSQIYVINLGIRIAKKLGQDLKLVW